MSRFVTTKMTILENIFSGPKFGWFLANHTVIQFKIVVALIMLPFKLFTCFVCKQLLFYVAAVNFFKYLHIRFNVVYLIPNHVKMSGILLLVFRVNNWLYVHLFSNFRWYFTFFNLKILSI
jgi:ABC-type sulfate transport system permease component